MKGVTNPFWGIWWPRDEKPPSHKQRTWFLEDAERFVCVDPRIRRLMAAVIDRAVKDLLSVDGLVSGKKRREAKEWVLGAEAPITFDDACWAAGAELWLIKKIQRLATEA